MFFDNCVPGHPSGQAVEESKAKIKFVRVYTFLLKTVVKVVSWTVVNKTISTKNKLPLHASDHHG
jgi:uncharacterized membrane protein YwaF